MERNSSQLGLSRLDLDSLGGHVFTWIVNIKFSDKKNIYFMRFIFYYFFILIVVFKVNNLNLKNITLIILSKYERIQIRDILPICTTLTIHFNYFIFDYFQWLASPTNFIVIIIYQNYIDLCWNLTKLDFILFCWINI